MLLVSHVFYNGLWSCSFGLDFQSISIVGVFGRGLFFILARVLFVGVCSSVLRGCLKLLLISYGLHRLS